MESEKYKQEFVGSEYEKVYNNKFSVLTLIFGPYYWAYRKMLIQALVFILIEAAAALIPFAILKNIQAFLVFFGLLFFIQFIASFLFGKLYRSFVNKSIDRIIDISDSEQEEMNACKRNGGTSILYFLSALIFFSLIFAVLTSIFIHIQKDVIYDPKSHSQVEDNSVGNETTNTENTNTNDDNTSTNSTANNTSNNKKKLEERKDGKVLYNIYNNLLIKNYIDVDIPNDFEREYNEDYAYEYYLGDIGDKDVTFLIAAIDKEDAKDFIAEVAKKNEVSGSEYSVELNDIKWNIVPYETRKTVVYYNAFNHKSGRVILLRYEVKKDIDSSSYEDIIYSLYEKEVDKDKEFVKDDDENKIIKIDNTLTNSSKNETNTSVLDDDDENNSDKNETNTVTEDDDNETNTVKDDDDTNETNTSKKSNSITINSVSDKNVVNEDEE